MNLEEIAKKYAEPDPKIVGKLPRGRAQIDYVGHAHITRILTEIDPEWTWEPMGRTPEGVPVITRHGDILEMWGSLTVCGKTIHEVGCAEAKKGEAAKELVSDFLRRSAMRFGVALSLWSKEEWQDHGEAASPASKPAAKKAEGPTKAVEAKEMDPRDAILARMNAMDEELRVATKAAFFDYFKVAPADLADDQITEAQEWLDSWDS